MKERKLSEMEAAKKEVVQRADLLMEAHVVLIGQMVEWLGSLPPLPTPMELI